MGTTGYVGGNSGMRTASAGGRVLGRPKAEEIFGRAGRGVVIGAQGCKRGHSWAWASVGGLAVGVRGSGYGCGWVTPVA